MIGTATFAQPLLDVIWTWRSLASIVATLLSSVAVNVAVVLPYAGSAPTTTVVGLMASPAISDGLLIVRALNHVYAFGEATAAPKTAKN